MVGPAVALMVSATGPAQAANLSESFDNVAGLTGWQLVNLSSPTGSTTWFQGNSGVFAAQTGAANAYIGANFNATTGNNTISDWLIAPSQTTLSDNDTVTFWTRTATGAAGPDRLEVRMSTNGSCSPGTTTTGVGDFTTLLTTVNPTLVQGVYPQVWTQFTATLTGLPGNATGCLAFRYFVTNGGPAGPNSDYLGIDTVSFTDLPDTTAPTVAIGSGPSGKTSNARPTFGFSANEAVTFTCRVTAQGATPQAFSACSGPGGTHSPAVGLADGSYTLEVRGTDPASNAANASRTFSVTAAACTAAKATLADAQKALGKVGDKLKKAKSKLKKAKESGTDADIAKAKAKVKKAKAKVKKTAAALAPAQAAVGVSCV